MRGAAVVALALLARVGAAQSPTRSSAIEARLDAIFANEVTTTHFALGVTRPTSRNLELQLVLGGGVTKRDDQDDARASGRADILARFAPPPASRDAWSAYASGGASGLFERGVKGRGVLVLLVGVRARRAFVEAGVGGGLRLGAGARF